MLFRCEVLERDLLILRKTFVTEPVVGEKEKKHTHTHQPTSETQFLHFWLFQHSVTSGG